MIKKKICSSCNKSKYIWSKGRCKVCATKEDMKKKLTAKPDVLSKVIWGGRKLSKKTLALMAADKKFYKECWDEGIRHCEECSQYLGEELNIGFISHILSRGSHPEMRHDKRNKNFLCLPDHRRWETGDKKKMKIWPKNEIMILELKMEYSKLK